MKKFLVMVIIFLAFFPSIAFWCSVPPDILHEFRIDTNEKNLKIHYTLLAWRNLHKDIREKLWIGKNAPKEAIFEAIKKNILEKSSLTLDEQKISLKFLSGSVWYADIHPKDADDISYSYLPDTVLEASFATDIPTDLARKHEAKLFFDKTPLLAITPLIHPFMTMDIMQRNVSDHYVADEEGNYYDIYAENSREWAVKTTVSEQPKINTFSLSYEPNSDKFHHFSQVAPIVSYGSTKIPSIGSASGNLSFNPFQTGESLKYFFEKRENGWIRFFGILVAVLVGAVHALLPWHSKTLLAGYMFSKNTSKKYEIPALIASITLSHTLSIFMLSAIIILIGKGISNVTEWMMKLSAAVYFLFGIYFLYRGRKIWKKTREENSIFSHKNHDNCGCATEKSSKKSGFSATLTAGIFSGINPCIDALALFVLALSAKDAWYAAAIILAFSLWLGIALAIMLILMNYGKSFAEKKSGKMAEKIVSIVTIVAGALLCFFAISHIF